MSKSLTLADLVTPADRGRTLSVDELHERARLVKAYQQRQANLKRLRKKYTPPADLFRDKETSDIERDPAAQEQLIRQSRRERPGQPGDPLAAHFDRLRRQEEVGQTKDQTGTKGHICSCGGQCSPCKTEVRFDRCHKLGEDLSKLDLAIALADQQLEVRAIAEKTKEALANWQGKSYNAPPSVEETLLRVKRFTLGMERQQAFDEMASAGCAILWGDAAAGAAPG
jgi:hypothetical protein